MFGVCRTGKLVRGLVGGPSSCFHICRSASLSFSRDDTQQSGAAVEDSESSSPTSRSLEVPKRSGWRARQPPREGSPLQPVDLRDVSRVQSKPECRDCMMSRIHNNEYALVFIKERKVSFPASKSPGTIRVEFSASPHHLYELKVVIFYLKHDVASNAAAPSWDCGIIPLT